LGKLNLLTVVRFYAQANLHPAAFKNDVQFKSGQNQLKNNHLASLSKICETLCVRFLKSKQNSLFFGGLG